MTTWGIEHFPQPDEWTETWLGQLGYRLCSVSIFDHWLTPEQWAVDPFISLERARAHGVEPVFHEQKQRFRDFYRELFADGAYRTTGSRLRPQVAWHPRWDRRLKKAVTAMVEDRTWGAEFYAPNLHVRVISANDRTDTLLLEQKADEGALYRLAARFGLYIIRD